MLQAKGRCQISNFRFPAFDFRNNWTLRVFASNFLIMSTSTEIPATQKKINMRRPDIMEAVQAQVLSHYRSELVERIRANGNVLSADGLLTVKLAKEFGFCYGVERAIDLAYAARKCFPPPHPIYLLGEIIHNPEVNDQIRNMGIHIVSPKPTDAELERLN